MAITAANLVLYGPATAQGQIQAQSGSSGSQAKELTGIATFTGDGAATTATLNWIDGTQKPFTTTLSVPVSSVTAPATVGGVANVATYSGVGAYGQLKVSQSVTFTGFTNAGNNGTFVITALTTSTVQVVNAGSVAESSNPTATITFSSATSAQVASAQVSRAIVNTAGVADTAAISITASVSSLTQTGCTVTFSAAPANGATCSVLAELFPNA